MYTRRLLLIDNYDSFTYNLVQAFLVLGADVLVHRNDAITVEEARRLAPSHLCISPGPGTPREAGVSMDMIRAFAGSIPVLGVCLGHQSIVEVFGGEVVRAGRLMHGKVSPVHHDGRGILAGMPQPFEAASSAPVAAAAAPVTIRLPAAATAISNDFILALPPEVFDMPLDSIEPGALTQRAAPRSRRQNGEDRNTSARSMRCGAQAAFGAPPPAGASTAASLAAAGRSA